MVDDPDTKTSWMPDIFMSDELDEFLFFDPIYAMLMAPDTDIALLNKKYSKEHPRSKWSTYETVRYQYLPLKDLYYDKDHGKENKNYQYGNQSYVRVLMVVAFLVGIIGLLNFINIYTVIMSKRSREFGVKKSVRCRQDRHFPANICREHLIDGTGITPLLGFNRNNQVFLFP